MRDPIGKADVLQDSKGLHVRGKLVLDDPVAARAHTLMKAGTIDGISVGYDVLEGGEHSSRAGAS